MKRALHLMFIMTLIFCNINLFANNYGEDTYHVSLGSGTDTDHSTPFVLRYQYSWSETIYPGSEIGGACTIEAISYRTSTVGETILLDELDVYMATTQKNSFTAYADWTLSENLIHVYSGENVLIGDTEFEKITLDIPFYFNGNDNLVVVVAKKTKQYNGKSRWYYSESEFNTNLFYANDKSENIADYPPTTSDQGTRTTWYANIMLDVVYGEVKSPITTTPNPIDFGYRPAASWTRPMTVNFSTDTTRAYILKIESLNPSFILSNYEAPIELTEDNPVSVSLKLTNSNVVGELNGKLRVTNNFGTDNIEMKAVTYSPVSPDVWEKAAEVTTYPYSDTPDFDNLYDNYYLPGETQDGPDAVYQLTLDEPTTLSVGVVGENAKIALYGNDFNGKGGPDTDNYYGATIDPDKPTEPEFPEVEMPVLQGNSFSYDFNDGSLADWRTIDYDGDDFSWSISSDGKINAGEDVKCLYSFSYNPATGSKLTPDNYIVTKGSYSIEKTSVLEFDVRNLSEANVENYEVVVSLDGVNFLHLPKETVTSDEWSHKTISLADYAGKDIVIGFRHFDVQTKSFAILIDNVVLKSGSRAGFNKTEKYTVPAGTYYLAVSATERFSVNINAATENGFNPVTDVLAKEEDNNVNLCWSWDFISQNIVLSEDVTSSKNKRGENQKVVLGYDIYRKNNIDSNSEAVLLKENVTDTIYVDSTWKNAAMGLYQWGVIVNYDDGNGGVYKTPAAYSNVIGKDMFTTFEVQLSTENGNSPEGAKISFYNVYEPSFKYEAIADATGRCRWDSFRKGTYRYSMSLDGYKQGPQNELMEIWEDEKLEYTFEEIFIIGDIFVSTTGWAMWKDDAQSYKVKLDGKQVAEVSTPYYQFDVKDLVVGQEYTTTIIGSKELTYKWTYNSCEDLVQASDFEVEVDNKDISVYWTLPVKDYVEIPSEFRFDFEDETLNGWISIDADGDGYSWANSKKYSQTECGYQSWYSAMSHSCFEVKPLTPDNYLATSKKYLITETSKLRFNVSAENKNESQEHYGVAISTKSNHNVADFKIIWEETLPKEENSATSHGTWYEKTIDLSEYAGQEVYIAFRHFNCTDQFWINIDNVELTTADTRKKEGEWFTYDNGKNDNAMGLQGGASFYWGMMMPVETVKQFEGKYLTKVSMFDKAAHDGRFMIYLGGDKAPGMLVHSQNYSGTGSNEYAEYELTMPVEITGEQNIWVIFNNYNGQYVASNCIGPTEPNGRWYSDDGVNWIDIVNTGYNFTWQVRAYVENIPIPNSTDVEVLGAMLYRDGKLLTETPLTEEKFHEVISEYGDYEYSLRVVYGGEEETYYAMSCPQIISLNHEMKCQAPKNLYGQSVAYSDGRIGTLLEWPYTLHGEEWLYYDNGVSETGLGLAGAPVFWAVMFPPEKLEFYNGTLVTKVSLFDYEAHNGNILIYYGGDEAPELLIHSQSYSCTGKKEFVEFELTSPMPIDATTNLWIVFNSIDGYYPAPICKDQGDKNGRWMSTDGKTWADVGAVPDLAGTFMVRAFVTSNYGRNPVAIGAERNEDAEFAYYNVYRGTTKDSLELVAQPTVGYYFDEVEKGTYYYKVTSTYFEGDVECESDYANSYNEPENDFIMVEVTSVDENNVDNITIYPNPVENELILATELNVEEIAIYDIYGRAVRQQVSKTTGQQVIDVADLEIGIYFISIKTDNGNIVRRFIKN